MIMPKCGSRLKKRAPSTNTNSLVPKPPPNERGRTETTEATKKIKIHSDWNRGMCTLFKTQYKQTTWKICTAMPHKKVAQKPGKKSLNKNRTTRYKPMIEKKEPAINNPSHNWLSNTSTP